MKNEDGRAMLIPFHPFTKNEHCVDSTQNWYVFTLLNGVPLFGAMDFSVGESMSPVIRAMEPISWGVLASWDFYLLPFW